MPVELPPDDFSPTCAPSVLTLDLLVVLAPDLTDVLPVVLPVVVLLEPRTDVSPRVVVPEWTELRSRSSTPTPTRWPLRISTLAPPPQPVP